MGVIVRAVGGAFAAAFQLALLVVLSFLIMAAQPVSAQSKRISIKDAQQFDQVVIEGSKTRPVIVVVWAPWSGPAVRLLPAIEELAIKKNAGFAAINVDEFEKVEFMTGLGVSTFPHTMLYRNGQKVFEMPGNNQKRLEQMLDE